MTASRQTGIFVPGKAIPCDGTSHTWIIHLPKEAPSPTPICAAAVILHTGTAPIMEIGGFYTLVVNKPTGPVPLVFGMNRHGSARWEHRPPIYLERGQEIVLTIGAKLGGPFWFDWLRRRWIRMPFDAQIQPDIAIYWLEESP